MLNAEFMLFVTVLVMGLLVGWVSLRDALNAELMDTANAVESSITFYYFNDPDRGLGPAFVADSLEFFQTGGAEGQGLDNQLLATPAGSVTPETVNPSPPAGTVTPAQ